MLNFFLIFNFFFLFFSFFFFFFWGGGGNGKAQSVGRATPGEEVMSSIPAVAAPSGGWVGVST